MFDPNKIIYQIIKNHNKKIEDILDGKFFNIRPRPVILSSRPMTKLIKKNGKIKIEKLKNFGIYNITRK